MLSWPGDSRPLLWKDLSRWDLFFLRMLAVSAPFGCRTSGAQAAVNPGAEGPMG